MMETENKSVPVPPPHWSWAIALTNPQQIACAIVAVWDYIHYRDVERFSLILALGQVDIRVLKTLLMHFLKSYVHQS